MTNNIDRETILDAIKHCAKKLGHVPSRPEFIAETGITEYRILTHFSSWSVAVSEAGLAPHSKNQKLSPDQLLHDWGEVLRQLNRPPTGHEYRRLGSHSPNTFSKYLGKWSEIPDQFRKWAETKPVWQDTLILLPVPSDTPPEQVTTPDKVDSVKTPTYSALNKSPTYGNPIDFRGLRHEPINENGVVFLFGMVADELGYLVEAIQAGFPDCEAKRQSGPGKWQRVRIEFEYASRNFRDHGHPVDGCDLIVCWIHNWKDCPPSLEVLELRHAIWSLL